MQNQMEFARKGSVLNMMVTMHSILSIRYRRYYVISNGFIILGAIILNAFVFFDHSISIKYGFSQADIMVIIGLASICVLFFSVLNYIFCWDGKAAEHNRARIELSRLRMEHRRISSEVEEDKLLQIQSFHQIYSQITSVLVQIPDSKFNMLKSRHHRKVEISKFISEHMGSPYWLLRCRFEYLQIKNLFTNDKY